MQGGKLLVRLMMVVFLIAGLVAATTVSAAPADRPLLQGPPGDWGDAPEGTGVNAYPSLGFVPSSFPTCMTVGPALWVYHALPPTAWFGPTVDPEVDGNTGICPVFPPFDSDECFADGDAGLILPVPYTISGGVETTCTAVPGTSLGATCTLAAWGPSIDTLITNPDPSAPKFVNVVIDWDQSGSWGGASPCPGAAAPEWVLVNFPVPPGFSGPLSTLGPPSFRIGPNPRFVWARFTISGFPIPSGDWDGSGQFQTGESEDYLLRIDLPLAVTVDSFTASAESDQILLSWHTISEIDNAGFSLWRSETAQGLQSLATYLPSQLPGGTVGAEYQFADTDVQAGQTYWYWLEAIDTGGQTNRHGPVSATLETPTAVSLAGMNTDSQGPAAALSLWGTVAAGLAALATAIAVRRRSAAR